MHLHHGQGQEQPAEDGLAIDADEPVRDQANVEAGTADVRANEIAESVELADEPGADQAADWPGHDCVDRADMAGRCQAARGLHYLQTPAEATVLEAGLKLGERLDRGRPANASMMVALARGSSRKVGLTSHERKTGTSPWPRAASSVAATRPVRRS